VVDNRYEKGLAEWGRKELSLTFHYPWLKLFPFPAQVILADNLKAAELRQMEESRPIKSLNNASECDCKDFRRWNLPCQHMLELIDFRKESGRAELGEVCGYV
jgi:hypothetical protein